MADRIKGITIEIGGDTTKLASALKDVNKVIKDTQSDLKDVDKLLKLDPKNTELLTQKHQLLSKAVGETKEKLQTLKTAQEQMKASGVDKSSTEYQSLAREIIECEQALKKLEKQARESNVALQKIAETGKSLDKLGNSVTNVGKEVSKVSAVVATGFGSAVKTTMDFDTEMSKVKSLVKGITDDEFEQLRNKAREMGKETRFSATESAEALSYMALAGWDTKEMLDGLEPILNLAIASETDLGTTSDIVTDALSAFGLTAEDTSHFVDVLAETSRSSNTNVEMLGESFKYAGTLAGGMNMSVDDVAVALGLMANNGIKSTQAGTSLRGILTRLAKPTKDSAMAIDQLGINIKNSDGSIKSMKEILDELRGAFNLGNGDVEGFTEELAKLDEQFANGTIDEEFYTDAVEDLATATYGAEGAERLRLATMLAGKNALSGFLALVNSTEEDYNNLTNSIANSAGASKEMREIMADNLGGDVDKLKSSLQELAISFGDILMPSIRDFVTKLQDLVDKFNGMDEGQKKLITTIGLIVVALGPLLVVIGTVISAIGKIMIFTPVIVGGITSVVSAIGGVVAVLGGPLTIAIVALIASVGFLISRWDDVKEASRLLGEVVSEKWNELKDNIATAINFIKNSMDALKLAWDLIKNSIVGSVTNMWEIIKSAFKIGWEYIKGIFKQKLEFPKIKLPHFKIEGKLSLNPPSVPSIGIDWYKKAYDDAYLLNSPTIFGASGGQLLGGGEGNGSEAVVGTDKLMDMMSEVVGNQNVTVVLEGDASEVFRLVRTENTRFVKSNGYSPLMA